MTTERDIELIEAYRSGTLSTEGREDVERRLKEDAEFAELFKAHSWTLDGYEGMKIKQLEAKLRRIEVAPPGRSFRRWWYLLLALLIALIVFVVVREMSLKKPTSNAILAEAYYEVPVSLVERNDAQGMPSELSEAFIAYTNGEWATAGDKFAAITSSDFQNTAKYYEAHCRYQLEQYQDAKAIFESLRSDTEYGQQASWFEALCLLKQGATDSAIDILETMGAAEEHFYSDRAAELLQSLANQD